jgi:hypothetical protein
MGVCLIKVSLFDMDSGGNLKGDRVLPIACDWNHDGLKTCTTQTLAPKNQSKNNICYKLPALTSINFLFPLSCLSHVVATDVIVDTLLIFDKKHHTSE